MTSKTSHRFRPSFWPTVGTLVGLALLISLGTWQFSRYQDKLALEEQRDERAEKPPVELSSLDDFEEHAAPFRPVALHGRLDTDYTFLFKHRVHNGDPGYWIGTVLRFDEGDGAVLVNRGWVHREQVDQVSEQLPSEDSRRYVGLVHQPNIVVSDDGMRQKLDEGALDLSDEITEWDSLDLEALGDALPFETPDDPSIVIFGPEHTADPFPVASYEYVTEPYLTSERHLGYALFWYITGVALLAMYLGAAFGYLGSRRHSS